MNTSKCKRGRERESTRVREGKRKSKPTTTNSRGGDFSWIWRLSLLLSLYLDCDCGSVWFELFLALPFLIFDTWLLMVCSPHGYESTDIYFLLSSYLGYQNNFHVLFYDWYSTIVDLFPYRYSFWLFWCININGLNLGYSFLLAGWQTDYFRCILHLFRFRHQAFETLPKLRLLLWFWLLRFPGNIL